MRQGRDKPAPSSRSNSLGRRDPYTGAGVDIAAGNAFVDAIKPLLAATRRPGVLGGIGGFGGLFDLKAAGFEDPLLVATTDGVGTKLLLARRLEDYRGIGTDLVAMCLNDLIVQGARPLFFLDYFATGKLDPGIAVEIVTSIAEACRACDCAVIGGETAEMPGVYEPGGFDLAGFAIGAVERDGLLPRDDITAGDMVIGLPSSGAHSNGFSLIRKIIDDRQIDLAASAPFAPGKSIGEALLTPTRLYVKSALAAAATDKVKAMAHITGGGILENLPRVLPEGLDAVIDLGRLPPTPFYRWLCGHADLWLDEVFRTFNAGIGFIMVVAENDLATIEQVLEDAGEAPIVIGSLRSTAEKPRTVLKNVSEEWRTCVSAS